MTITNIKFYRNILNYCLFSAVYITFVLLSSTLAANGDATTPLNPRFQKLDARGVPLSQQATDWSCTADLQQRLIWEVKTAKDGLRAAKHTYSWYQKDASNSGGFSGYRNGGRCGQISCDTTSFVQAVNNIRLCDVTNWRLPRREELRGIVDYSVHYPGPTISTTVFPNTQSQFYWSADADANDTDAAWGIGFSFGFDYAYFKSDFGHVRLVADIIPVTPVTRHDIKALNTQTCRNTISPTTGSDRFTLNDDGTIIDPLTGLQWMRCTAGQHWKSNQCVGNAKRFNLIDAKEFARHSRWADYQKWRVPNVRELASIVELQCFSPAINLEIFPATSSADYWTATPFINNDLLSWAVQFMFGEVHTLNNTALAHVKLVRTINQK